MSAAQSAALDRLLADQQNPSSPRFHQWVTPEQYAAEFGLGESDLARVSRWLQAQGLTVTQVARGRGSIAVSGTVAQIEAAFGTSLHLVRWNGEMHIVNVVQATFPVAFSGLIAGVTGLNDFRLKPHLRAHVEIAPEYTSPTSGNHYLAPGDFYTIYDVNPLLTSSISGSGITIAVLGQTDISLADVAAFRAAAGLPANVPAMKLFGSDPGTSAADIDEAQLDVEWAGAIAPSATILYVNSTDVLAGSLTEAIDNDIAPILSLSYGGCESGFGGANILIYQQLLRQASAQGQTVVSAAGDSGATACDYQTASAADGLAVYFPASSPYVTAVGGTMFNENGGSYWSAGPGTSSALSYIPEVVWNETATLGTLAAGGGGASAFFTKPVFQSGSGVPNDDSRDVPDVALAGGAAHDGYLFCSQGFCTNGFRNAAGALDVSGGTTAATPAFAGILALLEQKINASLGNANPVLYGLANSTYAASVFHDITSGNNQSPCVAGTTNCLNGGAIGYSAAAGFDLASGWGSVDVFHLVSDWLLVTPPGTGSGPGQTPSATILSAAAGSAIAGTSVALSVKVASAAAGVTSTPTGSVQLLVDNVVNGSALTLSGGAASVSFSTAGTAAGAHVLTAAYSGDASYAGSKSAVSLTIVVSTAGDFTLTPATAITSVASGGTAPGVTFSVTPVNGFTGNVTFTASATTASLGATYSFNVDPVVISSATGGSTVLTLLAYVPAGQTVKGLRKRADLAQPVSWKNAASGIVFAGLLVALLPGRRRRWALLALALLPVVSFSGCGGGSPFPSAATTSPTPPGTYTILVTATGTNSAGLAVTHNATVTFTVQ
jgi:subtilase family serine protease